jgi:diguanylate cyclase (GGDEF)-like protein
VEARRLPAGRVWALGALGVCLLLLEANELLSVLPGHELAIGRVSHLVLCVGSAALCAHSAMRHRGVDRTAWLLVAAGIAAWTAGDLYWSVVSHDGAAIPVPSPADVGYLAFPLLTFAGLGRVLRSRVRGAPRYLWVEAATASLAVAAVAAALVVPGIVDRIGGDWASVATNAAYPLTDLVLLGLVAGAIAIRGGRVDATWSLAGLGVVAFWGADSHYLIATAGGGGGAPSVLAGGWDVAFVALAAAATMPAAQAAVAVESRGRRVAALPLAFGALALGVLVYSGLASTTPVAIVLAAGALACVGVRLWIAFREHGTMLELTREEALTDALTGLRNRRALSQDLARATAEARTGDPFVLVLFDLDGFKHYNDSFGHPAGDDLLVRLGTRLQHSVSDRGAAYRMGGDEFCALLRPGSARAGFVAAAAAAALHERGDGFEIGASHGFVRLPEETRDPAEALRLADQRMYAQKHGGRPSAAGQARDVLLRALAERNPDLGEHLSTVAELAVAVARRLGLTDVEVEQIRHAADLHDVGKVAIPDAILDKPGPLDDEEWTVMRRHTIIGERIVAAAPALRDVARLVRASHERYDGAGYPDGRAGEDIPLGARIVAVCDAFDAMVADRPYRRALSRDAALAELERCTGTQFDPAVVAAFAAAVADLARPRAVSSAAAA